MKTNPICMLALTAALLGGGVLGARADASSGHSGGHGNEEVRVESAADAWAALMAARDAIAADVESSALGEIHAKAEPLPALVEALVEQSGDLEAGKRARVEGAAKQVTRVADALHVAADNGDAARTRKELGRLDGLLELIRAQYPDGALEAPGATHDHSAHGHSSAGTGHDHGAHAHGEPPAGVVDLAPRATLRVEAHDPFRFEPRRLEVQSGVPTRIELVNQGVAEHSLVVKTPDGQRDWVHLHVQAGETHAATYRLHKPGTYPIVCTIPGHEEGGMIGELVVTAAQASAPRGWNWR